tara:strand:+ start:70 stop:480 length:411 start_codon:yes stop_codon:yes gene_type:complete
MNNLTKWERYAPVSLGIEDMFKRLDVFADASVGNYPPYNIIQVDDTTQELQIALAGIAKDNIEVSVERGVLSVSTNSVVDESVYVHKGVAKRTFARNWQLGEDAVVSEPVYENGMLFIKVGLHVPEEKQRRVLPIA